MTLASEQRAAIGIEIAASREVALEIEENTSMKVLNDVGDVHVNTPNDKELLEYDANDGQWKAGGGHTIASHEDTLATGAELETLTDGSETALHSHATVGGDPEGDSPVTVDSESQTLAKAHAYKAQTAGFVDVRCVGSGYLLGYVGVTDNPVAETNLQYIVSNTTNEGTHFFVAKDKYFEIVSDLTVYIHWTPLITGGGAPIDQD